MNPKHALFAHADFLSHLHARYLDHQHEQELMGAPADRIQLLSARTRTAAQDLQSLIAQSGRPLVDFRGPIMRSLIMPLIEQLPCEDAPVRDLRLGRVLCFSDRVESDSFHMMLQRGLDMCHADDIVALFSSLNVLMRHDPDKASRYCRIMADYAGRHLLVGKGGMNIWFDEGIQKLRGACFAPTMAAQMKAFPTHVVTSLNANLSIDHIIKVYLAHDGDASLIREAADTEDYFISRFLGQADSNHGRIEIAERVGASLEEYLEKEPELSW